MTPDPTLGWPPFYWPRFLLCRALAWVSDVSIALADAVAPEEVKRLRRPIRERGASDV
jgi:hypothetical protein